MSQVWVSAVQPGTGEGVLGDELVGRVENFPSGADVLWYRKRLNPAGIPAETARDWS